MIKARQGADLINAGIFESKIVDVGHDGKRSVTKILGSICIWEEAWARKH